MLGFSPLSSIPLSSLPGKRLSVAISESANASDQELYQLNPGGLLVETGTATDLETQVKTSNAYTNYLDDNLASYFTFAGNVFTISGNIYANNSTGTIFIAQKSAGLGYARATIAMANIAQPSPATDGAIELWQAAANSVSSYPQTLLASIPLSFSTVATASSFGDQFVFDISGFNYTLTAGTAYAVIFKGGTDWNFSTTKFPIIKQTLDATFVNVVYPYQRIVSSSNNQSTWSDGNSWSLVHCLQLSYSSLALDTGIGGINLVSALTETGLALDTGIGGVNLVSALTETGTATETESRIVTTLRDVTETGSASDNETNTLIAQRFIGELVSGTPFINTDQNSGGNGSSVWATTYANNAQGMAFIATQTGPVGDVHVLLRQTNTSLATPTQPGTIEIWQLASNSITAIPQTLISSKSFLITDLPTPSSVKVRFDFSGTSLTSGVGYAVVLKAGSDWDLSTTNGATLYGGSGLSTIPVRIVFSSTSSVANSVNWTNTEPSFYIPSIIVGQPNTTLDTGIGGVNLVSDRTETVTASENESRIVTTLRDVTETGTATETESQIVTLDTVLTETSTATETETNTAIRVADRTEPVTSSTYENGGFPQAVAITETGPVPSDVASFTRASMRFNYAKNSPVDVHAGKSYLQGIAVLGPSWGRGIRFKNTISDVLTTVGVPIYKIKLLDSTPIATQGVAEIWTLASNSLTALPSTQLASLNFNNTDIPNPISSLTSITNSILGAAALTKIVSASVDDASVATTIPWPVNYLGKSYTTVYVGSNSYLTFGGGATTYSAAVTTNPSLPKICISVADNSYQQVFAGTEGTAPNRTYRIRYEGNNTTTGVVGTPTMVWEITFYENNTSQIDIQVGANSRGTTGSLLYGIYTEDALVGDLKPATATANIGYRLVSSTQTKDIASKDNITFFNFAPLNKVLEANTGYLASVKSGSDWGNTKDYYGLYALNSTNSVYTTNSSILFAAQTTESFDASIVAGPASVYAVAWTSASTDSNYYAFKVDSALTQMASDNQTNLIPIADSIEETGTAAETESNLVTFVTTLTETGTATETENRLLLALGNLTETGTATETESQIVTLDTVLTETGTATETESQIVTLDTVLTETGTATDTENYAFSTLQKITEVTGKNRYRYANQFDQWSLNNVTMSADSVANPLTGAIDADQLSNTPSVQCSVNSRQLSNGSWTAGVQMTKSVYAKLITGSPSLIFQAIPYNPDGSFGLYENATFNLSTGLVQSTSGATTTASMVSLGNGWYRCIQTFTPPNPGNQTSGIIAGDSIFIGGYGSTSTPTTQAFYGGQLEFGGSATTLEITSDTFGSVLDAETGALTTNNTLTESGTATQTENRLVTFTTLQPEVATTNLVSESQSNYTARPNTTIISTTEIAPDGTPTAVRVRLTAAYGGISAPGNPWLRDIQLTGSAWVKVDTGTRPLTFFLNGGGAGWTGTFTATSTWTRYSTTYTKTGVNYNDIFCIGDSAASGYVDIIIWGIQVEAGATASTYQVKPIIESNASQLLANTYLTETGTATETESQIVTLDTVLTETGTASETESNLVSFVTTLTETGTASETESNLVSFVTTLTETGTAADSQFNIATLSGLLTETGTAADTDTIAASSYGGSNIEYSNKNYVKFPNSYGSGTNWSVSNATASNAAILAPDGTYTGQLLVENTATAFHTSGYSFYFPKANTTYTLSCYVKSYSGDRGINLQFHETPAYSYAQIDIDQTLSVVSSAAQASTSYSAPSGTVTAAANGWYRVNITATTGIQGNTTLAIILKNGGAQSYLGNGTSGIYLWGVQVEEGSSATTLQDPYNLDTYDRAYFGLGAITENGTATNTESNLVSFVSSLTETGTASNSEARLVTTLRDITESGTLLDSQFNVFTTNQFLTETGTASNTEDRVVLALRDITETATANETEDRLVVALRDITETATVNETETTQISFVSTLLENTNKNLFYVPSDLSNSIWTKAGSSTITSGQTDPNSGTTAFLLTANLAYSSIYNITPGILPGTYTVSVYVKYGTSTYFTIVNESTAGVDPVAHYATFQMNGTPVINVQSNATATLTSIGNSWYLATITYTLVAGATFRPKFWVGSYSGTAFTGQTVYLWRPQVELGSSATAFVDPNETVTQDRLVVALRDVTETSTAANTETNITTRLADVTEISNANNNESNLVTFLSLITESGSADETETRVVLATRDITETGLGTDIQFNVATRISDVTESGTANDTENRTVAAFRSLTETSTTTDDQFNVVSFSSLLTESGALTDSQFNVFTTNQFLIETGTASDTENRTIIALRDVTESGISTDSQFNLVSFLTLINETANANETENRLVTAFRSLTESATSADQQFNIATRLADITESSTSADSQFNISVRLADVTETGTGTDSQFNIVSFLTLITETGTADNSEDRLVTAFRSLTESGASTDQQFNIATRIANLIETGTASDTENRTVAAFRSLTETGTGNDSQSNLVTFLTLITESGSADETETRVVLATRDITESGSADETETRVVLATRDISETNTSTDSQFNTAIRLANLIESITATELTSAQAAFISAIQEALSAIDSGISNKITTSSISEIISALDSQNRVAFYAGNISELLDAVVEIKAGYPVYITEAGELSTIELANLLLNRGVLETVNPSDSEFSNVIANSYITEISVAGESMVVWVFFPMDYELVTSRYSSLVEIEADQIYADNIDVFYVDSNHMFADVSLDYDQIYVDDIDVLYGNLAQIDGVLSDEIYI